MAIKIIKVDSQINGSYQFKDTILENGDVGIIYSINLPVPHNITIDMTPLTGATASVFIAFADKNTIESDVNSGNVSENYWKASGNLASVTNANAQSASSYDVFTSFASAFKITSTGGQTIVRGGI